MDAMCWWLHYVLQDKENNYHVALLMLTLGHLYQKRIYPKLILVNKEYRFKLNDRETLALSMSFVRYDYFDAPTYHRESLYQVFEKLPTLKINQIDRFDPPVLLISEEE
ncbi:MAG: hypothetical protein AAFY91_12415 [Bacteroidota bacterium]